MTELNREAIVAAIQQRLYGSRIVQNNYRGEIVEQITAMVLGEPWKLVSAAWHPCDLEATITGHRVRIQCRNSAAIQNWVDAKAHPSRSFTMKVRRRPWYFAQQNEGGVCEDVGHLCEVYVLGWHGETDRDIVDHGEPSQWRFHVVPVNEISGLGGQFPLVSVQQRWPAVGLKALRAKIYAAADLIE